MWVGLWDPATTRRLPLSNGDKVANDGDDRIKVATIKIAGGKPAARPRSLVYVARKKDGDVLVDGKIDEGAWKKASRTANFGDTRGGPSPVGDTWAKVLYDDTHLYVALHGDDKDVWGDLEKRDSDTWTQEVFEVFVDPDGDAKDYVEMQVTPRNVVFDARFAQKLGRGEGSRQEQIDRARAWNSKLVSAVHVDGTVNNPKDVDKAWSAEISIPFEDLPGDPPKAGETWRINFYRFDAPRDSKGKPQRQVAWAWAPPMGSFHNVERFGTLRFGGSGDLGAGSVIRPNSLQKLSPVNPVRTDPAASGATDGVVPDKPE